MLREEYIRYEAKLQAIFRSKMHLEEVNQKVGAKDAVGLKQLPAKRIGKEENQAYGLSSHICKCDCLIHTLDSR
jgi:hypothetical protein